MHSETHTTQAFAARYSDGRTATTGEAQVQFTAAGIEIRPGADAAPVVWPYSSLETATPVTRRAADVLLHSSGQADATLFIHSPWAVAELLKRAPHISATSHRFRWARFGIAVTAVVAAVAGTVWWFDLHPAKATAMLIPDGARTKIGERVITQLSGTHKVCDEPEGRAALDNLLLRLSAATGTKKQFRVKVVDWGLVNAFAAPGEQIVVTRGLIAGAGSPEEVSGVIAHEMGHGLEIHPETALVRAIGISAATELVFTGNASTITNIGVLLAQLRYSRIAEREADAQALRILKTAGISSRPLADFFRRIEKEIGKSPYGKAAREVDIISTHPASEERIRVIEAQPDYPSTPAMTAAEWQALKVICGVARPGGDARPGGEPRSVPEQPKGPQGPVPREERSREIGPPGRKI